MFTIKNFFPHSVTGKTDDSFVGVKIVGSEIHFYYPESYRFDVTSASVRSDIIDLLRTIAIAKTMTSEKSKAHNKRKVEGEFALMSYLWVINDYLANGFYVNREKIYKHNQSGRVDWKRTMQSNPIVSNGNIIYPNITVEVKNNVDNLLVEIHKFCVKKSIDYIGWLFNLNSSFIQTKPYTPVMKKLYVTTVKKELEKTFDDNKRLRLRHLLNVLEGLDSNENGDFVYGVDSYYYIFERMVDAIFGNVEAMKEFNPKGKWRLLRNGYRETPSSELRPDTIIVRDNSVFILDSKFYRFGFTGREDDLPETTSIQKQITYGDFIKKNVTAIKVERIYNAFLMPYDKTREVFKSDCNLQYVGYAKSTWKDNDKSHELVHAFLIDLTHVIKTWSRSNHEADVAALIGDIVERQKQAEVLENGIGG